MLFFFVQLSHNFSISMEDGDYTYEEMKYMFTHGLVGSTRMDDGVRVLVYINA